MKVVQSRPSNICRVHIPSSLFVNKETHCRLIRPSEQPNTTANVPNDCKPQIANQQLPPRPLLSLSSTLTCEPSIPLKNQQILHRTDPWHHQKHLRSFVIRTCTKHLRHHHQTISNPWVLDRHRYHLLLVDFSPKH